MDMELHVTIRDSHSSEANKYEWSLSPQTFVIYLSMPVGSHQYKGSFIMWRLTYS